MPLAQVPGVRLISLQKHHGLEQLAGVPDGLRIETLGDDFDAGPDAFIDTAAVMQCLDMVITSDTSVAHLAGALGRPVWVGLQHVPDWRWLLEGEDCLWYPTMRLFRQTRRGDWAAFADGERSPRWRRRRVVTPCVPVSWGELIDKITILEIKAERLRAPGGGGERGARTGAAARRAGGAGGGAARACRAAVANSSR